MTRKEVLDAVMSLHNEEQKQWLITLGWEMTISAGAGYPLAQQTDSTPHLIAFNELQHKLYNY
jgi:hypothetical protein